jgi:hypothetical protein
VDTHVKRLRKKLGSAGRFIQCVHGVGYRFSETPWGSRVSAWTDIRVHATREIGTASTGSTGPRTAS